MSMNPDTIVQARLDIASLEEMTNAEQIKAFEKALSENHAEDVHLHDMSALPYQVSDGRTTSFRILH